MLTAVLSPGYTGGRHTSETATRVSHFAVPAVGRLPDVPTAPQQKYEAFEYANTGMTKNMTRGESACKKRRVSFSPASSFRSGREYDGSGGRA